MNYFYYYEENDYLPGSTIHKGLKPDGLTYEWFSISTPDGYNIYSEKYFWTHKYYIHYRERVDIPTPD